MNNLYERLHELYTYMNDNLIEHDDNIATLPSGDGPPVKKCTPKSNERNNFSCVNPSVRKKRKAESETGFQDETKSTECNHFPCSDLPLRKKRKRTDGKNNANDEIKCSENDEDRSKNEAVLCTEVNFSEVYESIANP